MNKPEKKTISVEDKLLHQDRWIVFLIILGMATVFFTIQEFEEINKEPISIEEKKNLTKL